MPVSKALHLFSISRGLPSAIATLPVFWLGCGTWLPHLRDDIFSLSHSTGPHATITAPPGQLIWTLPFVVQPHLIHWTVRDPSSAFPLYYHLDETISNQSQRVFSYLITQTTRALVLSLSERHVSISISSLSLKLAGSVKGLGVYPTHKLTI